MTTLSRLTTLFVLIVVLVGCAAQPTSEKQIEVAPVDVALVEHGIEVYRANYCGSCHTLGAANTRGTFGPNHDTAYSDAAHYITLSTYTGDATTAEDYIRESVLNPTVFYTPGYETTNHHMPAFGHLSKDDVDALIYLLIQQNDTQSDHQG